ncbi:MAG: hypothetical protein EYC68_06160 [Chloroflexota bacterium]|nr:MAG: hypothetical protein EYC68_06160 [Chloroflexota bacterium]
MVVEGQVQVQAPDAEKMAKDATEKAKQTVQQAQGAVEEQHSQVTEAAGKLVLASIGGVALAGDAAAKILNRMVERGEQIQKDARRRANQVKEKGQGLTARGTKKAGATFDTADLSTKSDMQSLHDQIAELSAKVDQLAKTETSATSKTSSKG